MQLPTMCVVLTTAGGSRTFCSEDERIDEEGEIKKLDLRMPNVESVVHVWSLGGAQRIL